MLLGFPALAGSAGVEQKRRPSISFGLFVPGQPEQGLDRLRALEQRLDRPVSIVHWYQHWGSPYSSALNREWLETASDDGRRPLITWEPWDSKGGTAQSRYRLAEIAAGRHDPYIRSWARALAAWGRLVYLRPMHEMNGNWYPWAGSVNRNTPRAYRAAWRRLHEIFRSEGAVNVKWVWCVNARSWPDTPGNALERYYPGGAYVDVLAADGYNRGGKRSRSFDQIFSGVYARLERLGPQPIWITETGSHTRGVDKAAWVRSMFSTASSPRYRRLRAIVWFSAEKAYDYRADSPPRVAEAFRLP